MFIVPMDPSIDVSKINAFLNRVDQIGGGSGGAEAAEAPLSGFREVFEDLIRNVEQTEAIAEEDAYRLATGALDDPHTAMINAAKAELTLSTMVQIRNKVLDAYSEIMRINV
jgi:flagellar hook-basal body complex protein FliE